VNPAHICDHISLSQFFLERKLFQVKDVEEIKTDTSLSVNFFPENRVGYEIMWENVVWSDRPQIMWESVVWSDRPQMTI
jgi:hypothetical protein